MKTLVESVRLADEITGARETLRALWGGLYDDKAAWWRDLIRKAMEGWKCSALEAVPRLVEFNKGKATEFSGVATLWLIAAAADVAEGKT